MFANRASLVLAVLLRVCGLYRVPVAGRALAPAPAAFVLTWLAGAIVLLGSYDAVSGASASVSGAVKYSGTTPVGAPTNYIVEPLGQTFKYRITVTNPGVDFAQNYFNCVPLPPGLTINTNPGAAGYITGVPTAAGAYAVTLVAGNLNFSTPSLLPATLVIFPPNAPPVITNPPASQSVLAGSNVTFSFGATGSLPMGFQWSFGGANLLGQTSTNLTITNVTTAAAGDYRVVVTNTFGSVTSAVARLTLREPFLISLVLSDAVMTNDAIRFQVAGPIYTNYVVWRSTDLRAWTPIKTNWVLDGYLGFSDPGASSRPSSFYRASLLP